MKESYYVLDNEEESFKIKENVQKYAQYWRWFLLAIVISFILGFLYLRYAPTIYESTAKIKIIDDSKELDIATDPLSALTGGSKINMDNEIEVLKSYRLLQQVVNSLDLEISYYEVGNIKTRRIFKAPFDIVKLFPDDSLKTNVIFDVSFETSPPKISDDQGVVQALDSSVTIFDKTRFPVEVRLKSKALASQFRSKNFEVVINKKKETVLNLSKRLEVNTTNKNSEVLSLLLKSESPELSEAILNGIIYKFDQDGILDRQLVSKRTIDFIDNRFIFLTEELDSIESGKKDFKKSNNLSYIEADAGITMQQKSIAENDVFEIETQIALSKLLKKALVKESSYDLLPADIGLENNSINSLVSEYNKMALEREKLITSAGLNNPTVKILSDQLKRGKLNIVNTVDIYQDQLNISLGQMQQQQFKAGTVFSELPEKEMTLRAIERQQSIKENLFLILLQKREEAAINFAVTAPSVKVVDYGLTKMNPISPKKPIVYAVCLFLGLLVPFGFLFVKFSLDDKIKSKADLEKLSSDIPVLAEIPSIKNPNSFFEANERSIRAESFKILGTNVNFLLPKQPDNYCKTIYVTSAIKGEGKTFIAHNLSMAYASLRKKVLLIGADLRNPQLHNFFDIDKNTTGLSDFLYNPHIDWRTCVNKGHDRFYEICFSGPIPPNASELIANENFEKFLDLARKHYDYVIVDTAPTVLVADTLLMSEYADITVFVTRANFTDKRLIEFSKDLHKNKKLKNMAFVLNDITFNKKSGYNYGYEYGYGSKN
ncbi:GumC family protein [Costertonia aggregata]|uniref:Polysaccharide biosynthesis tyrosine autokinase n=1 Tax=Costertonia aggregata TaxID=343403 RepID=A0A7H9AM97_9FLAO|nr:polysaccharide biosynthesis tyrosine autokinase [Costertonia aggregata]QLG44569.1 polysaccharide biosynthesis tyrosine autokinase [Costertonia aggregata]